MVSAHARMFLPTLLISQIVFETPQRSSSPENGWIDGLRAGISNAGLLGVISCSGGNFDNPFWMHVVGKKRVHMNLP